MAGKSGDGLDCETELRQLRVIGRLAGDHPAALVPTFLGAHEVPPEFRDRRADYVRLVCEEMIPAVARERLAVACDVFCEPGVCSVAEARTVLDAARRHGLAVKLHADEFDASGGAELAVEVGALSGDPLADWREVAYWMGGNAVTAVWTGGSACPLPIGSVSLGPHVEA